MFISYRYTCTVSRYGGHVSTLSRKITSKQWFQHSVDGSRKVKIEQDIQTLMKQQHEISQRQQTLKCELNVFEREIDALKAEIKNAHQKYGYKQAVEVKLQTKRNQMKEYLVNDGNTEREKERVGKRKSELGHEMLKTDDALKKVSMKMYIYYFSYP